MKLETKFGAVLCLLCVMIIIWVWLILTTPTANAESHTGRMATIVSFDSAEHLLAITDSIAGVCDTIYAQGETKLGYVFVSQITCRKNVRYEVTQCVSKVERCEYRPFISEVDRKYDKMVHHVVKETIPGEAIISYEEVKCIK